MSSPAKKEIISPQKKNVKRQSRKPRAKKPVNVKRSLIKDVRALLKSVFEDPELISEEGLTKIKQILIEGQHEQEAQAIDSPKHK